MIHIKYFIIFFLLDIFCNDTYKYAAKMQIQLVNLNEIKHVNLLSRFSSTKLPIDDFSSPEISHLGVTEVFHTTPFLCE